MGNAIALGQLSDISLIKSKEIDYSVRYADNWGEISLQAKLLTKYKCCFLNCRSNCVETHHALYSDKLGMIAGREVPGVHVFPLCQKHHKLAHSKRNWICAMNPVENNRNTPAFYLQLRMGWDAVIR